MLLIFNNMVGRGSEAFSCILLTDTLHLHSRVAHPDTGTPAMCHFTPTVLTVSEACHIHPVHAPPHRFMYTSQPESALTWPQSKHKTCSETHCVSANTPNSVHCIKCDGKYIFIYLFVFQLCVHFKSVFPCPNPMCLYVY